jgi:hypothetical protein
VKRRWRRLRIHAWRFARHQYLLPFTVAALVAAAALGTGVLSNENESRPRGAVAAVPTTTATVPRPTPSLSSGTPIPRSVTFFLVSSEEHQTMLNSHHHERFDWLNRFRQVVIVINGPEDEAEAQRQIDEAADYPLANFTVEVVDLRLR